MSKEQSEMLGNGSNRRVHSFLDNEYKNNIKTKIRIEGIRSFTGTDCMQIFIGDFILKWSDDGLNKVIYLVTQTDQHNNIGKNKITTGIMKDLVAAGEITNEAVIAIEKGDNDILKRLS